MKRSRWGQRRFIISSFFICFLCALASINEVRFDSLLNFGRCTLSHINAPNSTSTSNVLLAQNSSSDDEIRILFGILTLPDQYHRRHFPRMIYGTQTPLGATVDVKFVFCNLTKEDQKVLVALEIMRYDDIIILNCKENMNKGKTYTYFSSLPEMFNDTEGQNRPYRYVMKADDDAYFRLQSLVDSLKPLPRQDLYYGYVIPCPSMDPFVQYMSGMGYLISWDIGSGLESPQSPTTIWKGRRIKFSGIGLEKGIAQKTGTMLSGPCTIFRSHPQDAHMSFGHTRSQFIC